MLFEAKKLFSRLENNWFKIISPLGARVSDEDRFHFVGEREKVGLAASAVSGGRWQHY